MGAVAYVPHDFSEEEISVVRNTFPLLTLDGPGLWVGELSFDLEFNGHRIADRYQMGISAPDGYPDKMPSVAEVGGRTAAIAEKHRITDLRDLHINPKNRTICVCVRQEEKIYFPPGSNLVTFINNLVIPYLYGLSYYEERGVWPGGEYSHDGLGPLEYHAETEDEPEVKDVEEIVAACRTSQGWKEYNKQFRRPSSDRSCLCGSRKPFRQCHPTAWRGLVRLRTDAERLDVDVDRLFQRKPAGMSNQN